MKEPTRQEVGARLLYLRKKRNLTRDQVYARTGIEPACLRRWEVGLNEPMSYSLYRLSEFYGVSMDWIFKGV